MRRSVQNAENILTTDSSFQDMGKRTVITMRIEKISGNKLKITVTQDDMMSWGISFESIADDPSEIHEWFWDILKQAEAEADFDIENSQLMIEAMPGKNDEMILFLTSIGQEAQEVRIKRGRYRVKRPAPPKEENSLLYCFESFDNLCIFAKEWQSGEGKDSIYLFKGKYYLHLCCDGEREEKIHAIISEYATRVPLSELSAVYLSEHGKIICKDNGIETIRDKF